MRDTPVTQNTSNWFVEGSSLRHADRVEHDENTSAFVLATRVAAAVPGVSVRESDSQGAAVYADGRVREQLDIIAGRRLSQFSVGVGGTTLAFWGTSISEATREVFIEQPTIVLAHPDGSGGAHATDSEALVLALLSVLGQRVSGITLSGGQLSVSFEAGLTIRVEPDQHYESWQINSDDGLLIVCTPGGDLVVWYPISTADPI
jgi:uncharacterized protein DUF6188